MKNTRYWALKVVKIYTAPFAVSYDNACIGQALAGTGSTKTIAGRSSLVQEGALC